MLNRKIKETLPDGKATVFVYDKNGNLTKATDPNGTITTNVYDVLGRLSKRTITPAYKQTIKGASQELYVYDALGRLSAASSTGQLAGSGGLVVGSTLFAYDSQNRLLSETQTIAGRSATVSYGYDANGNRTSVTSGTGYLTNYSFDALNRLTGVSYNSGSMATYTYSGTLLGEMNLGNGVATSYGYDSLLRLSSLSHAKEAEAIAQRNYGYDPASNLTSDGEKTYAYDSIDRLTGAFALSGVTVPVSSASFEYDLTGNRTASNMDSVSKSYSGNILNQYLSTASNETNTSYVYDANGNLTNNGAFTFAYDYRNRLVLVKKASDSSLVAEYVYDTLGRRVQKLTPTTKIDYTYSGENAILETTTNLSTSAELTTNRVYGAGTDDMLAYETDDTTLVNANVDEYIFCARRVLPYSLEFAKHGYADINTRCNDLGNQYTATERKIFYVQKDHLGSIIALTDSSGSLVQSYAYDVYGTPYIKTGSGYTEMKNFVGNLHGNDRLFTGREYDRDINLYYYRARFYSSELGRFISRDPIGMSDDVNLYAYVKNSPMMGVDPSGLFAKKSLATGGKALAGVLIGAMGIDVAGDDQEENARMYANFEEMEKMGNFVPTNMVKSLVKGGAKTMVKKGVVGGAKTTFKIGDKKIIDQMKDRGWSEKDIEKAVKNPKKIGNTIDNTYGKVGDKGEPATAYFINDNQYAVINNNTREVFQVSNRNDLEWTVDARIIIK